MLCKTFVALNLLFRTINNAHFRQLLQMLRFNFILVYCIKLLSIIFSNYKEICAKIKQDLKEIQRVFIALNV
jgi:hypothetical protein